MTIEVKESKERIEESEMQSRTQKKKVARKMAQGVRKAFHTTFGLSTTGVAGPTGGTKRSPIGRVFIGLADGRRTWVGTIRFKRKSEKDQGKGR